MALTHVEIYRVKLANDVTYKRYVRLFTPWLWEWR